jgi:hypothetical protein
MKTFYIFLLVVVVSATGHTQTLQSVTPNFGYKGTTGLSLQISGSGVNFNQASYTQVTFTHHSTGYIINGYAQQTVSANLLDTKIDIPFPADAGLYNLTINYSFGTLVLNSAFTVLAPANAPQIIRATPDSSMRNVTLDVNISGLYTHFTSGTSTHIAWLVQSGVHANTDTIYPNSAAALNDTLIVGQFTIPSSAPLGYYDVHTLDLIDGELVKTAGFLVYDTTLAISAIGGNITGIEIFPNPASNLLTLTIEENQEQWSTLSVFNASGIVCTRKRIFIPSGHSTQQIDLSSFSNGVYIINLFDGTQQVSRPLVVVH